MARLTYGLMKVYRCAYECIRSMESENTEMDSQVDGDDYKCDYGSDCDSDNVNDGYGRWSIRNICLSKSHVVMRTNKITHLEGDCCNVHS